MKRIIGLAILSALLLASCNAPVATTSNTTVYSRYELEYRLLADFPDIFWNDPDFYPIAQEGQEQVKARDQFSQIETNEAEFTAILGHLSLDRKNLYTDEEKLLVYRQHKLLTLAVQMTPIDGGGYRFVLRIREGEGERIEGTITALGAIKVEKREPSINSHPICLAKGTLIETPHGLLPVEDIVAGMLVWTLNNGGERIAAPVLKSARTEVSAPYHALSITLSDGRALLASSGHPSADGRPLCGYRLGDTLDGAIVVRSESVRYLFGHTYDILPSGGTGLYWANGILLRTTLNAE